MTVRPVVAATDGSGESLRAVEWAAREAGLRGAPLFIVSAASLPKMVTLPLEGPAAQAVAGRGPGALMLVTGSRGLGAFTAMVLGSVARYAAGHAACAVVMVRDTAGAAAAAPSRLVGVGVGDLDGCARPP